MAVPAADSKAADGSYGNAIDLDSRHWWTAASQELPPLDPGVLFTRRTNSEPCDGCTANVMALEYEQGPASGKAVHAWPLYVHMVHSNSWPSSNTVYNGRSIHNGSAWVSVFHGEEIAYFPATGIGFNIESSPMVDGTNIIGFNALARNGYGSTLANKWSSWGLHVHSETGAGWHRGVFIEGNYSFAVEVGGTGSRAIAVRGEAPIAYSQRDTQKLCFNDAATICFKFNAANGQLQLLNGSTVKYTFKMN